MQTPSPSPKRGPIGSKGTPFQKPQSKCNFYLTPERSPQKNINYMLQVDELNISHSFKEVLAAGDGITTVSNQDLARRLENLTVEHT